VGYWPEAKVPNAVLHPWLKEQLLSVLEAQDKAKTEEEEAAPKPRPAKQAEAQEWETWAGWLEPGPPLCLEWQAKSVQAASTAQTISWI
jgi:hypothetical protein